MEQILHDSVGTTYAVRIAIQRSKTPLKELAAQYGLNQNIVAKRRRRAFVRNAPMGSKAAREGTAGQSISKIHPARHCQRTLIN